MQDERAYKHSFIDLYVNASSILKSNNRFQRVKSHLEHKDYKKAKDLLDEILERSEKHNRNVSEFISSVENNIMKSVFKKDVSDGIVSIFIDYTDPKQKNDNGYSMANILKHYAKEAVDNHSNLRIDQEQGTPKFQINREDVNINIAPMVISVNRQELEIIKEKLESKKLKTDIVDKLEGFFKEGQDIIDLYNDKFIDEIKNIITEIEDEEEIKGGCGLRYCPKKSHFFN